MSSPWMDGLTAEDAYDALAEDTGTNVMSWVWTMESGWKGSWIVIPTWQQEQTLHNMHTGHQGLYAMEQTVRNLVY